MKTTMNISVDQNLKDAFSKFAREIWTNPTNLINMLMQNSVNNGEVLFSRKNILDIEIEPFNDEEIESFWEDFMKKTQENTKKLEKLLVHI